MQNIDLIDKFQSVEEDLAMGKELSEMTLEELWDLFPIFLVQHDDQWNEYYKEIKSTITDLLAGYPVKRISHIGSTAIQDIRRQILTNSGFTEVITLNNSTFILYPEISERSDSE